MPGIEVIHPIVNKSGRYRDGTIEEMSLQMQYENGKGIYGMKFRWRKFINLYNEGFVLIFHIHQLLVATVEEAIMNVCIYNDFVPG